MGVSYTIFPLDRDEIVKWLQSEWNIQLTYPIAYGRYPSPNELKRLLESLNEYKVEFVVTDKIWQATISAKQPHEWAHITVHDFQGELDQPHHFYFERGYPEVVLRITKALSSLIGTLILLKDNVTPVVITPTTNIEEVIKLWDTI